MKKRKSEQVELQRLRKKLQKAIPEARASLRSGLKQLRGALISDVWNDLADTPEQAANLRARSTLMQRIRDVLEKKKWTRAEAAAKLGGTRSRINDLISGRMSRFSLEELRSLRGKLRRMSTEDIREKQDRDIGPIVKEVRAHVETPR